MIEPEDLRKEYKQLKAKEDDWKSLVIDGSRRQETIDNLKDSLNEIDKELATLPAKSKERNKLERAKRLIDKLIPTFVNFQDTDEEDKELLAYAEKMELDDNERLELENLVNQYYDLIRKYLDGDPIAYNELQKFNIDNDKLAKDIESIKNQREIATELYALVSNSSSKELERMLTPANEDDFQKAGVRLTDYQLSVIRSDNKRAKMNVIYELSLSDFIQLNQVIYEKITLATQTRLPLDLSVDLYPNRKLLTSFDKVTNTLFLNVNNGFKTISLSNKKNEEILIDVSFENEETNKLTATDRLIMDAIMSYLKEALVQSGVNLNAMHQAHDYKALKDAYGSLIGMSFSPTDILNFINQDKKSYISRNQIDNVIETVNTFRRTDVKQETNGRAYSLKGYPILSFYEPALSLTPYDEKQPNGEIQRKFLIKEITPYMLQRVCLNQNVNVPIAFFNTGERNSSKRRGIILTIILRIVQNLGNKEKAQPKMSYETIFKQNGIDTTDRRRIAENKKLVLKCCEHIQTISKTHTSLFTDFTYKEYFVQNSKSSSGIEIHARGPKTEPKELTDGPIQISEGK